MLKHVKDYMLRFTVRLRGIVQWIELVALSKTVSWMKQVS